MITDEVVEKAAKAAFVYNRVFNQLIPNSRGLQVDAATVIAEREWHNPNAYGRQDILSSTRAALEAVAEDLGYTT
jgi:hypothetical protein